MAHDFGYVYENYSKVYLELPSKQHYHHRYYEPMRGPKFWTRKRWYQEHGIDIAYLHLPFGARYNRSATGKLGSAIEYRLSDNSLYLEVDEELYDSDEGRKYVSDIEGLEKWCDIKTDVTSKRLREC